MSIILDRNAEYELRVVVAKRLINARSAARLKGLEAAEHIGHRNGTQIALAEAGQRLPPLLTLIKLADLYGVSLDYLCGRIEDPLAEPIEVSDGVLAYAVKKNVEQSFGLFADLVAKATASFLASNRDDRDELRELSENVQTLAVAFNTFVLANPEFEDMPKASRFVAALATANSNAEKSDKRIAQENEVKLTRINMIESKLQFDLFS